jgi:lipopolysaccharide/colanic/teichoic acid biosynthesis glycosyltransferase
MTLSKRLFDILLALLLAALLFLPTLALSLWLLARQGRPLFYRSERMKTATTGFQLWKFRTMTVAGPGETGVSGGDKAQRVTPEGRLLRRLRLDEIPQLWNILRGDMSFVGPRPPLRQYVERDPALYARVLQSRPGLTGLATLHFRHHEERLLAACATPEETDAVYARRCVPRKARLDLIYQARRSTCGDARLILATLGQILRR